MNEYTIAFLPSNKTVNVQEGRTLLDAQRLAGLKPDSPCGGKGICNKCKVNIIKGNNIGIYNACKIIVDCDMTVVTQDKERNLSVLTDGAYPENVKISPKTHCFNVVVNKGNIGDSRSDFERLCDSIKAEVKIREKIQVNIDICKKLNTVISKNNGHINVVMYENEVIDVRTYNSPIYALAYDIGTTTIACYLLDCSTGQTVAMCGTKNPQVQFGADVLSRCIYARDNDASALIQSLREAMDYLASQNIKSAGITADEIYMASVVGNTCMHHFFVGIFPGSLLTIPYAPTIRESLILNSRDYLSNMNYNGKIILLPLIAGFVGSDTVGVLLSTGISEKESLSLILDMGTNGELVLGNKYRRMACSTASGPAFEGAQISCGMRCSCGAIDHIRLEDGDIKYSTVDNDIPIGICGSGIVDIVSLLLEIGIILPNGRFQSVEKLREKCSNTILNRLQKRDDETVFVLSSLEVGANGSEVYINQKDIRQVQLAKAAIASGIKLMVKEYGTEINEISDVFIAGAFCSTMSAENICKIGLIPKELRSKITIIGNSAGIGAKLVLINENELEKSKKLARETEHFELASHLDFQKRFISELDF